MRSYLAFLKKEVVESIRNGRLLLLGILFFAVGVMNPAITKLTPWIMEMLADTLAESGMSVSSVSVDAMTSWIQFFKNVPLTLIAFLLIYGGCFTSEFESNTLILVLTKGMARYKILLAKTTFLLLAWTAGYWLCFGVTLGYNSYFWADAIPQKLLPACTFFWIFGIWTVCLLVLFSTFVQSYGGVILSMLTVVAISYAVGLLPMIKHYAPTALIGGTSLLRSAETPSAYLGAAVVALAMAVACILTGIYSFNRKRF